jgi:membrane protein implicated in regulation of membrane protease activity
MKKTPWTYKILIRYILLQIPGTVLLALILVQVNNWIELPQWIIWFIVAIWVAKDIILFPFVWSAYDWHYQDETRSMIGKRGVAKERLAPSGYIQIYGELWKAKIIEGNRPIEKGEGVLVEDMQGLILLVRPNKGEGNK